MIITRPYLDNRRTPAGKPAPIKISLTFKKDVAYLSTGIKIPEGLWSKESLMIRSKSRQAELSDLHARIDRILFDLQEKGALDGLTMREVRDIVADKMTPRKARGKKFLACMQAFAESRKKKRTREIYRATINKIIAFQERPEMLDFKDITLGWLDRFDSFLSITAPKKNARNVHLRNIRAVFNDALKRDPTINYPFRQARIRPEKTAKKSLTAAQLRTLFNAELPQWQKRYVDFFQMAFLLIGINTEDLVHASEIVGGRLIYQRAKTYMAYTIKVEEECMAIIDRHRGQEHLLDVLDTYSSTHTWTSKIDRELKTICAGIGLPRISMNWARHSWATIASELDIPKETVAASMGHSSNTVTDIYINFDIGKIDRANRKVIDYVLYNKKDADIYEMIRAMNERLMKQDAVTG
jgi:integrase